VAPSSKTSSRRIDFHSHSYLTDGRASPTAMWTEARLLDHASLALTDHIALEDPRPLLDRLHQEARAFEGEPFVPVVGVELTQVPPRRIAEAARTARRAGAEIVIVHGETIFEHVPPGTNHAAIESNAVDVLAHPGILDPRDAALAKAHGIVLEISGRNHHGLTNGHVVRVATAAGAELVVDSDAHSPNELIPLDRARTIALGAGVTEAALPAVLHATPESLFRRLRRG
jgi:putative hydrolase